MTKFLPMPRSSLFRVALQRGGGGGGGGDYRSSVSRMWKQGKYGSISNVVMPAVICGFLT